MKEIVIDDMRFQAYITEAEIQERIRVLALMINENYQGQTIDIIVLLKGAFVFAADLLRHLQVDHNLHFAKCTSYEGMESSGLVKIKMDDEIYLKDKQILIIEDIIDTGKTLLDFVNYLNEREPLDISIASLLYKHKKAHFPFPVEYCGFKIDDAFVIGYGMDYNQKGRQLKEIFIVSDEEE